MKLTSYQAITNQQLTHSGLSYRDLANQYGTPLYIFDETSFIQRVNNMITAFKSEQFDTQILYASKSLLTLSIAKLIATLGIGQDVVSQGEIYIGLQGGVDASQMYFHGNNKSDDELRYALENKVGTIVVDNRQEAERLMTIATEVGYVPKVLLRINPGIEAHTHDYIKTASLDSKFGESIFDTQIDTVIHRLATAQSIHFAGFHCHIGSQIFDESSFMKAAEEMIHFAATKQAQLNIQISELNFGGGFGVYYTKEDKPFDITVFLPKFIEHVESTAQVQGLVLQKICIEPGRSLVNESGSTLYTVGDTKQTVNGKNYLFIDGGMTDNIRPSLYQAEYEATIVNKMSEATTTYTVAGKACESGDILIQSIELPAVQKGDLLLVNGTGAYNFSMASNYNRLLKPAMIHIADGKARLTVKRETLADLIRNESI